jgi:hypothetical protein
MTGTWPLMLLELRFVTSVLNEPFAAHPRRKGRLRIWRDYPDGQLGADQGCRAGRQGSGPEQGDVPDEAPGRARRLGQTRSRAGRGRGPDKGLGRTRPRVGRGGWAGRPSRAPWGAWPGRGCWSPAALEARSAALYEFLISTVEKAIIPQTGYRRILAGRFYAGWARRNRPKCGTVNAIRPRSEL